MAKIYALLDGAFVGFGIDALRRRFHATVPDSPSASDLAYLGVVELDEPARPPETPAVTYTLGTRLDGGSVVAEWTAAQRPAQERTERRAEFERSAVAAVREEALRRLDAIVPDWQTISQFRDALRMERKERLGGTLTQAEQARLAAYNDEWSRGDDIVAAAKAIIARIHTMTDAEAGVFDVATAPEWPA